MKPALARGALGCIGATVLAEYRQHIEKDAALERRFQPIMVNEPSPTEAQEMLARGYQRCVEEKHHVAIDSAALHAAVTLAARYLPERRLPDKAIDFLDEACARVAVPALSVMPGDTSRGGGIVTAELLGRSCGKRYDQGTLLLSVCTMTPRCLQPVEGVRTDDHLMANWRPH